MSLLPATSHANPTTPFWATSGGGGGGAVTSIIAGNGIDVDTPTGDVTITNKGVTSLNAGAGITVDASAGDINIYNSAIVETNVGAVQTGSNTLGIVNGDTWNVGTIKQPNFYPTEYNFYIAGITINLQNFICANPNYDGNIWVTLDYSDGISVSLQGRETINIVHTSNNYYSASVVIAFQHQPGGVLNLNITNETGGKINSFDYAITNFYCCNNKNFGSYGLPLF